MPERLCDILIRMFQFKPCAIVMVGMVICAIIIMDIVIVMLTAATTPGFSYSQYTKDFIGD